MKKSFAFLWIDDYKGIVVDQEINFGSEYIFHATLTDRKVSISCRQNDEFIHDFFKVNRESSGIDNITAFAGKNGTGKTLMCKLIGEIVDHGWEHSWYVSIVKESQKDGSNNYLVYTNSEYEITLDKEVPNNVKKAKQHDSSWGNTRCIYYSPIVDFSNTEALKRYPEVIDISSNNLWYKALESQQYARGGLEPKHFLTIPRAKDFERQYEMIMEFKQFQFPDDGIVIKYDDIHLEIIKLKHSPKDIEDSDNGWNVSYAFKDIIKYAAEKYEEEIRDWTKQRSSIGRKKKSYKSEILKIDQEICVLDFTHRAFVCFLYNLNKGNTHLDAKTKDKQPQYHKLNFLETVRLFFRQQKIINPDAFTLSIGIIEDNKHLIEFDDLGHDILKIKLGRDQTLPLYINHLSMLSELDSIHGLKGSRESNGFMDFDWGVNLSSGEHAYLNLFSRMHYARKIINRNVEESKVGYNKKVFPENLIIILDEGELGFHPNKFANNNSNAFPHFSFRYSKKTC